MLYSLWLFLMVVILVLFPNMLHADAQDIVANSSAEAIKKLGPFSFRVRDVVTGRAIQAAVAIDASEGAIPDRGTTLSVIHDGAAPGWIYLNCGANGRGGVSLLKGSHRMEVSAPSYKSARTYFEIGDDPIFFQVWLDPEKPPRNQGIQYIESILRPGYTLWDGYVLDSETAQPVSGVLVWDKRYEETTTTDIDGYFMLLLPAHALKDPFDLPETDDLVVQKKGYKTHIIMNNFIEDGANRGFLIDLESGQGFEEENRRHKLGKAQGLGADADGEQCGVGDAPPPWAHGCRDRHDVRFRARSPVCSPPSTCPTSIRSHRQNPGTRFCGKDEQINGIRGCSISNFGPGGAFPG